MISVVTMAMLEIMNLAVGSHLLRERERSGSSVSSVAVWPSTQERGLQTRVCELLFAVATNLEMV